MIDEMRLLEYRKKAVEFLEYACEGNPKKGSDRYLEITEGRNAPIYSACGDLGHWMLFRLGFRMPWINRKEHLGWKMGVNISRLVTHGIPYDGRQLDGGDIIIIANRWPSGTDAHCVCIIDQVAPDKLATAEYGLPGGGLQTRKLPMSRATRVVLPLESMIQMNDALEAK